MVEHPASGIKFLQDFSACFFAFFWSSDADFAYHDYLRQCVVNAIDELLSAKVTPVKPVIDFTPFSGPLSNSASVQPRISHSFIKSLERGSKSPASHLRIVFS